LCWCHLAYYSILILKADDANICGEVLRTNSFNTYNNTYQSNVNALLCTLHIDSRSALENKAANLQSGGQYGLISGFLDAAESSGSSSAEETYDKVCNKHDSSFISSVFASNRGQITDRNVDAWERCVEGRHGLFSALTASRDNKTFTISVHYVKPEVKPAKLVLKAIDPQYGFQCTVSGVDIADYAPEDHGGFGKFGITCWRSWQNTNNTLLINTSVDQLGPFDVPSKDVAALSDRVQQDEAKL
jgi:hypothetical protein